jgi:hypothetical protein
MLSFSIAGACLKMDWPEWGLDRRRREAADRMANSLVTALRGGALEFTAAAAVTRGNVFLSGPEDAAENRLQLIPSRRQLLGYPRQLCAPTHALEPAANPVVTVRLIGQLMPSAGDNLLFGVPTALLKAGLMA